MTAYNDLPATFGCDLGADALSDDPLVPEIVGILVRGENVALLHADRLEQTFGIVHDLFARRTFFLSGRDDLGGILDRGSAWTTPRTLPFRSLPSPRA